MKIEINNKKIKFNMYKDNVSDILNYLIDADADLELLHFKQACEIYYALDPENCNLSKNELKDLCNIVLRIFVNNKYSLASVETIAYRVVDYLHDGGTIEQLKKMNEYELLSFADVDERY